MFLRNVCDTALQPDDQLLDMSTAMTTSNTDPKYSCLKQKRLIDSHLLASHSVGLLTVYAQSHQTLAVARLGLGIIVRFFSLLPSFLHV